MLQLVDQMPNKEYDSEKSLMTIPPKRNKLSFALK
jgi:hypothetical protein